VGAGVEEDYGAFRGGLEGREHAVDVEALGFGGEVRVGFNGEVDVCEDLVVVGPSWGGEVDGLVGGAGVEFGEEYATQVDGAGAGDGLEGYYTFFGDGGGGGADDEALRSGCEFREACYGEVFVVEIWVGSEEGIRLGELVLEA
jgi:hypothetical protein